MSDFQETPQAKTKRSNVLFGCLGAALVVIVLAAGGLFWWISSSITTDPAAVAALMGEILPGAKVPDGYSGQGIDMFGQKMVMLGGRTSEGSEGKGNTAFIVVSAIPVDGGEGMEEVLRQKIAEQTGEGNRQVADLGTEAITVGGVETQFKKSRITDKDKPTDFVQYVGILPASGGRSTMIMIMGPADKFDRKGMDAFLGSITPVVDPPSTAPQKR